MSSDHDVVGLLCLLAVIFNGLLDQFLHELGILPDARDFPTSPDQHSFAILNVVLKFADVDSSVRVDFLTMLVANSVFEEACDLGSIIECVGAVTSHAGFSIFTDIFVAELEIRYDSAVEVASLELALEYSIHILQIAGTVESSILEFSFVMQSWLR